MPPGLQARLCASCARGAMAAMHLAVWPFVVALRLTAAVKPAEVTQRTSPLLILFCGLLLLHRPGAVTCG